jgi:class 3 adenylate cyclase/tetratricopeptide (TPR) repeat protein
MVVSAPDPGHPRRADLVPFLPRLTLTWLHDHPERRWQELEGTLVFVDISGFTALSERLSSLGKEGAEQLTDVIDATFASLLEVAYACGGGLLKFGGDALLLLFSGADHAPRAARAAFEMNELLQRIGRVETDAGTATLRMHVGIHSGDLHFFLVGDTHRELLVTGAGATATVGMEAGSEAGEILVSHSTAAAIDRDCLGSPQGPGLLLRAAPAVEGEVELIPDPAGIPLEHGVPAALRAQLLEVGPLEGEHRPATVAFIRYQNVDALIERVGPEGAAGALDDLVRIVQHAAANHGVTFLQSDIDSDGGKIILVSGVPQTHGDNEERMLRTVRAIVDASPPVPLHVGVSRGRIFAGQVGFSLRRTYTVMGDTVALAARLMARAQASEIIVAADALERSNDRFEADELEPFEVKGLSAPVRAFALGAVRESRARVEEAGLPFVDRDEERALLSTSVESVRLGHGKLVELVGEPGIGKSRLAEELRRQCGDMLTLTVRCEQYESSTPYHAFRPLLRSLLSIEAGGDGERNRRLLSERLSRFDAALVPWAPLLAAPLDVEVETTREVEDLDPEFRRPRLHGLVSSLLGHVLDTPTLLTFDDAHWMDEASSELLHHIGGRLSTRPWLVCASRRPIKGGFAAETEDRRAPALTLQLGPLPTEDAKALVKAAAGGRPLSDDAANALVERGAGNPLFLEELAVVGTDADELPETVEALLATRIDRLAPRDRMLLRWASVLGISFSAGLVAELLSDDRSAATGFESRLAEFLEPDPELSGGFRFRHALVRDVAYEGLSYRRRRELHGRAGEAIERLHGDEAAELLSLHFHRAQRWPEVWRYSVEAGRRAWEKYANVEAAQFYERALEIARRAGVLAEEVARVWEALGDARIRAGAFEQAGEAFRAARGASPQDPVEQARLLLKEALVPMRLTQYPRTLRRLGRALRMLEGVEGPAAGAQRARILAWYGTVYQRQRRFANALESAGEAVVEAEASGARDALAHAYRVLDGSYVSLGRPAEAVYSQRALEIHEELGELEPLAWVVNNLGVFALMQGRWNDALTHFERAGKIFERIGDFAWASITSLNSGQVLIDQGRLDEAEPLLTAALEAQKEAGNLFDVACTTGVLGRLAARAGRFDEAHTLLAESRELLESVGDAVELLAEEAKFIELLVLEADPTALEAADAALARSTADGASMQTAMLQRLRGWALLQAGELAAAREAMEASIGIVRSDVANPSAESVDYELALSLDAVARVRGLLGERSEELEAERDTITRRLDVTALPQPPLTRT